MSVAPLPARGGVHLDPRRGGRALRVSAHPELGLVTISIWRDDRCVATHQVPVAEMPGFVGMLTEALLDRPAAGSRTAAS
ncbi:MAG TPA: hypothetical protein VFH66_11240 [Mycobacteriales bacterium]|nr:hypothetical protein [Mycobacteriales bacterium]